MQPGFDFFLIALVVEGQQAVEDGAAGGLADRVAYSLFGFVESVI